MAVSVSEIKEELEKINAYDEEALLAFAERIAGDPRAGVRALAARAGKKAAAVSKERERLSEMRRYERELEEKGYTLICGVDEAGRGPLAGPVVAGAVILDKDTEIFGLNDSKKLSAKRREELFDEIMDRAVAVGCGIVGAQRIDEINILQADYEAMCEALGTLSVMPQVLINDAVTIPQVKLEQLSLVHGDAKSVSVAAASIIAKVTRDRIMDEYDALFPEYGFAQHKGYGTAAHYEAIKKYGPCQIHRKTFLKTLSRH